MIKFLARFLPLRHFPIALAVAQALSACAVSTETTEQGPISIEASRSDLKVTINPQPPRDDWMVRSNLSVTVLVHARNAPEGARVHAIIVDPEYTERGEDLRTSISQNPEPSSGARWEWIVDEDPTILWLEAVSPERPMMFRVQAWAELPQPEGPSLVGAVTETVYCIND